MTEDEAKTKWCPFARLISEMRSNLGSVGYTDAHNRRSAESGEGFPGAARCIGSACMAWRVVEQDKSESVRAWQRPAGSGWFKSAEHTYDTLPEWTRRVDRAGTGFCGLAGKP